MYAFRIRHISWSIACAMSVSGCAAFGDRSAAMPWRVAPAPMVTQAQPPAEAAYQAGRRQHAARHYERAIAAYRDALQRDPAHVGARNGLAVVLAVVGRHDDAVRQLQAAVTLAPDQAYLRNNLGYAYLLRGALPQALKEIEEAARLDPANPRAAENLALVRARLAVPADAKSAPGGTNTEKAPAPPVERTPRRSLLVQVSPQVYEMRRPPDVSTTAPLAEPAIPAAARPLPARARLVPVALNATPFPAPATQAGPAAGARSVRLEVSNGNGLNGFAKRIATALSRLGWNSSRLTNQIPFQQPSTEVQYREGYAAEALRLAAALMPGVLVVRNEKLASTVDVRLVLGRDAWTESGLLRGAPGKDDGPQQVAGASVR